MKSSQRLHSLTRHEGAVNGVAFGPAGHLLATASDDRTVRVWSLLEDRPPQLVKGHTGAVWSVAFSTDGQRLASSGDDGVVQVWDPLVGQPTSTFGGHPGPVCGVAFSPDDQLLASVGATGSREETHRNNQSGEVKV